MSTDGSIFEQLKDAIEQIVPLDRDYLHVLAGAILLACYLGWKAARKRPFRGYEIVGIVFTVAFIGEILDFWRDVSEGHAPDLAENLKDILLTLLAPLVAALGGPALRRAARLWHRYRR